MNSAEQPLRTFHRFIFTSIAFALLLMFTPAGFAQSHWEVKPTSVNTPLNAVAFGSGLFVAVGDNGVILTSPDGEVWTPRVSGTTDRLPAVAFGSGRFVVTRENQSAPILTSLDGITWVPGVVTNTSGTPIQSSAFATVAFGEGRFMTAAPTSSVVLVSTDGTSFNPVTIAHYPDPGAPLSGLVHLTYLDHQFFAATTGGGIHSSADGIKWKWRSNGYGTLIATDGVRHVAGAGNYASFSVDAGHTFQASDGPKDRYFNLSSNVHAICYGAGVFVAVDGSAGIWTSERGEYWRGRGHYGSYADDFRGVAFDGAGRFVAVGWALNSSRAMIVVSSADAPPPPPPAYKVYSLRDLSNGAFTGEPRSVSNSGIVGGLKDSLTNNSVGQILRDGVVTTYPDPVYGGYPTVVTSVNDNGVAALEVSVGGSSYKLGVSLPDQSRTFPGGGIYSTAPAINASGIIGGNYYNYDSTQQGIYRYNTATGETVDLGNFGLNRVHVTSISDRGDIAGTYDRAFNGGVFPFRVLADGQLTLIPTLGGAFVWDVFTNSSGVVAGSSSLPSAPEIINATHAFLYQNGVTSDIDLLNSEFSWVLAMNNQGDVVGEFTPVSYAPWQHFGGNAFLYHDGAMYDLNRLLDGSGDGWLLYRATGISDNGRIVGLGWLHGGHLEPFMAVPTAGSPAGMQTRFVNVSTRLRTSTGDDALIAGFVLRGGPKRVILRALGPALRNMGFPNLPDLLSDPTLELFNDRGERIAFNDNYTDLPYSPDQSEIASYRLNPPSGGGVTADSVIAATLPEGSYTAVVRGKDGTSGNCLVEVYNVDTDYSPGLLNISTRGPVGTGDNVMIAGIVIRGDRERRILIRGVGPSLAQSGVANPLQDPMLEIHDQDEQIAANDDWRSNQEAEILAAGFAPGDDRDAAMILSLWPGNYTAIVRGKANGTGNALVEVYALP